MDGYTRDKKTIDRVLQEERRLAKITWFGICCASLVVLLITVSILTGCANKPQPVPSEEEVYGSKALSKPPSYSLLARSLAYYERTLHIEFYRNEEGIYMPYAMASWDSFSISDRLGGCLFDVEIKGVRNFRDLEGRRQVLLELEITEGPCNIQYPNVDLSAADRVSAMEGALVSPRLLDRLDGHGMCSDRKFLESALQMPYKMEIQADDVEGSIARIGDPVDNPLDLRFGDVVFFSPYPEETTVGIYVGYGLLVYNSCFGARSHKIQEGRDYRIYRLVTGFAWTRYRIHQEKFLQQYVGVPQ